MNRVGHDQVQVTVGAKAPLIARQSHLNIEHPKDYLCRLIQMRLNPAWLPGRSRVPRCERPEWQEPNRSRSIERINPKTACRAGHLSRLSARNQTFIRRHRRMADGSP